MKTLKQLYIEKLDRDIMKIWSPATLNIQAIIDAVNEANEEWLQEKRQWIVEEISKTHTKNCAHKFIMVSDLEELNQ